MGPVDSTAKGAGNIRRYYLYIALEGFAFGLFVAMWVIYLQRVRGFTLAQAAVIDVAFFVAAALGEVPTGIVADILGRRRSVAIGTALMAASTFVWTVASSLPLIIAAYVCLGVGFTFVSGAQDALLYESVDRAGRSEDYTRVAGRTGAAMVAALAAGSAASGLLARPCCRRSARRGRCCAPAGRCGTR